MDDLSPAAAGLPSVRIAHVSDTHLAHEAYPARAPSGWNLRGEDMVRAFHTAVDAIRAADPALVIHSGDVSEIPTPPVRYMLAIRSELARLAEVRPDGSRRQVVVIAGNHDMPRLSRAGCYLDLFSGLPGVHVVTSGVRQISFDDLPDAPDELDSMTVTAVPHESLKHFDDLGVPEPVPGRRNVLVAHGVAEATELFRRSVGREYTIPASLLVDDWSYVALGHWHTQGPVTPPGASKRTPRIWYAGSTESVDFGDCKSAVVDERGWLDVTLDTDDEITVTPRSHPTRRMVTLPTIDITEMDPDSAAAALVDAVRAASPDGAVLRQRVVVANRDVWAMVPLGPARDAAGSALLYRVDPVFADTANADGDLELAESAATLGAVGQMLAERAEVMVPALDRPAALAQAHALAGAAIGDPELTDADADAGSTPAAPDGATAPAGPSDAAPDEPAPGTDAGTDVDTVTAAAPPPPPSAPELSAEEAMAAVLADLADDGDIRFASELSEETR
jgi:DNA repair exonuclease SbcCD nuclease subunit